MWEAGACADVKADLRPRVAARWREAVDGAVRTEIPDGLRLTLPTERAGAVATLAAAE